MTRTQDYRNSEEKSQLTSHHSAARFLFIPSLPFFNTSDCAFLVPLTVHTRSLNYVDPLSEGVRA